MRSKEDTVKKGTSLIQREIYDSTVGALNQLCTEGLAQACEDSCVEMNEQDFALN